MPHLSMLLCCCLVATVMSEFVSNVSAANILLPVLAQAARRSQVRVSAATFGKWCV